MVEVIDQTWVPAWQATPMPEEQNATIVQWLLSLPPNLQNVAIRFPPFCLVRGSYKLTVPFPFSIGIVTGYLSDERVVVQQEPNAPGFECPISELTVVGFRGGWTPNAVAWLLQQQTVMTTTPNKQPTNPLEKPPTKSIEHIILGIGGIICALGLFAILARHRHK